MSPREVRQKNLFPYMLLWHLLQKVGGMVFPPVETKVQPAWSGWPWASDRKHPIQPMVPTTEERGGVAA
jgi:hypothetical protein